MAHGDNPIPPTGWGAVELIIWQTTTRLRKRGISIHVINKPKFGAIFEVLKLSLQGRADVVFCHAEKPIRILTWIAKIRDILLIATTHNPVSHQSWSKALQRCYMAPFHFVGRADVEQMILAKNPNAKCAIQLNATETQEFETCLAGNGRAICLGRIQERKRQNDVSLLLKGSGLECDFVGPLMEEVEISDELRNHMIGPWDRETLHRKLCEYSCHILLSRSERQPLAVIEALAAGIPVVVSPDAAWNLDDSKPYILVVDSDSELVPSVKKAIEIRNQVTENIRQYAVETFDYEVLVDKYLAQVDEWLGIGQVH